MRKLLAARVRALEPVVEAVLSPGGGGASVVRRFASLEALPGDYLPLLERYVGHLLVEGMMQGRDDVEFLRRQLGRRSARLAAIQDKLDGEPVVPDEALAFLRTRRQLGKFFEKDQVDIVRSILDKALAEGATVKQTMGALQAALPDAIGRARAENIARTEATMAYNQGRLASFRDSDGFVAAVEFMAITDARTTAICRERDGLVLALDDPALPSCTPPLHFMCRSILSPVSPFELEDLGGDEYLAKMKDRLEKAPPPLEGFGTEQGPDERPPGQPPVVAQPKPPAAPSGASTAQTPVDHVSDTRPPTHISAEQPMRAADGGVGYDPPLPKPKDCGSRIIDVHGQPIEIRGFWVGHGELARVRRGLEAIRPERLQALDRVEFTNEPIPTRADATKRANGVYRRPPARVELSRAAARNWSDLADGLNRQLALDTLWHEAAHHVWYEDYHATGADNLKLRRLWSKALKGDNLDVPAMDRLERFAELFAEFMGDPVGFRRRRPHLASFYAENIAHPAHQSPLEDP